MDAITWIRSYDDIPAFDISLWNNIARTLGIVYQIVIREGNLRIGYKPNDQHSLEFFFVLSYDYYLRNTNKFESFLESTGEEHDTVSVMVHRAFDCDYERMDPTDEELEQFTRDEYLIKFVVKRRDL